MAVIKKRHAEKAAAAVMRVLASTPGNYGVGLVSLSARQ